MRLQGGSEIDGWKLQKRLGKGGNSEVWEAVHRVHGEAALKILSREGRDRRIRFADEIKLLQKLGRHPGVLPLIDARLPGEKGSEWAWLASPVAVLAPEALGRDPGLSATVTAVSSWAETLADLAEGGVGHRDIKPSNLFRFEGRWVLGDFGLATYPEKEPITGPSRRLGPLFFMAPEMLRAPDGAAFGPADVYSLAKTFWVLATGERYPPEGQIRADLRGHDLRGWIDQPGALAIGALLEEATRLEPGERPTMASFAGRIAGWREGDARQDDDAEAALRRRTVEELGASFERTLDERAVPELEAMTSQLLANAQTTIARKRDEAEMAKRQEIEDWRTGMIAAGEAGHLLKLLESAWPGPVRDGRDWADAVMACPIDQREEELRHARRLRLGRPLWWLHTILLSGALRLLDAPGCEPLAKELAVEAIRDHLLAFTDTPSAAAAWRLQRSLIPATARIGALAPFEKMAEDARARLSAADRLHAFDASRLFMVSVNEAVRQRLLTIDPWTSETIGQVAAEVEESLGRLRIPDREWIGPMWDPWLESWKETSPMLECGLAILRDEPAADALLDDEDLRRVIEDSATTGSPLLQLAAAPLAKRLGLL
jgi:Protein kinase domain